MLSSVYALKYSVTLNSPSSVNAYEGDKITNKFSATITNNAGECVIGCTKDCSFSQCENGICEPQKWKNCVTSPNDCRCSINEQCNKDIKKCELITCGNGRCDSGETFVSCPNDCKEKYITQLLDADKDLPVVFVHGHSPSEVEGYSPTSLEGFQDKLVEQGYVDMGIMLPSDYPPKLTKGVWSGKKVSVIMTYYANKYDKLGGVVGPDDNQHISIYAQRLRDVVETVKHNTGKNKVIIIAHSMGGLVSRTYIKYYGGINSIEKLVTIGTPNHGTYGLVAVGCGTILAGRSPTPECEDMKAGSNFLTGLNSNDETLVNVKYLTIIARNSQLESCPDKGYTDNVICAVSVYLEGAENYYYDDYSSEYSLSNSLHTAIVHPSKAPKVYNQIVEFIKED